MKFLTVGEKWLLVVLLMVVVVTYVSHQFGYGPFTATINDGWVDIDSELTQ